VSFSDKRVADLVNAKFVAAWINRGPGFNNTEYWTEKGIVERNYEAYPTKNICTFFLTPEGKVFYYVAGSYSPDLFLKILETATLLRTALFDEKMQPKEKGRGEALRLHEDKADAYDDLKDRAAAGNWKPLVKDFRPVSYRGIKHVHSESCGWSLQQGYEYLAALHREWQGRTKLPSFEDIRFQYLYGNDFTEETAESHITAPPKPEEPVAKRLRAKQAETQLDKNLFGIERPGMNLFGK
jgi:hypothetical protein